jgi:hypothetical protein
MMTKALAVTLEKLRELSFDPMPAVKDTEGRDEVTAELDRATSRT